MTEQESKLPLKGSNRLAVPDAHEIGPSDPGKELTISIYTRQNPHPDAKLFARIEKLKTEPPNQRKYLSDKEFNDVYGASATDFAKIETWAKKNKLSVVEKNPAQKRVSVRGTVQDISNALGVTLNEYQHPLLGHFRGRSGNIFLPKELHTIVEGVFGLDTRPIGQSKRSSSHFPSVPWKSLTDAKAGHKPVKGAPSNPFPGTFFPGQVAKLYNYPDGVDGTGQNIAVFVFNNDPNDPHGGYDANALKNYYVDTLGQKYPNIKDVVITGPGNFPAPENNGFNTTGEVYLDMCIVGALVPGANIFPYFTEFTSKGWVDALHDAIAGKNSIDVISISYSNPEKDPNSAWSSMGVKIVNKALAAASAKGISICCSSGDSASMGAAGHAEVEFPASSPNVLAVGGTSLVASANMKAIVRESVWHTAHKEEGTGGGISVVFSKPAYQDVVNVPPSANPPHGIGRGVPDIAAVGDPNTGVMVMQSDGVTIQPVGGTSASAPLWASLIVLLNQSLGANCGYLNHLLYTKCANNVLNDITIGNNGAYHSAAGWDACTGLGTPDGEKLLEALK